MKTKLSLAGLALLVLGGWSLYALGPKDSSIDYRLGTVETGNIESVVVSTGTLAALHTVIVGSQLSGQLAELHVDFNDAVQEGDLMARIDPRTFAARVRQSQADVAVAAANIESRKAELKRQEASLGQATRELARRQSLKDQGHVSASELDRDLTLVETTEAQVAVARAAILNAEALLEQREAALAQAQLDLERSTIRSPVSGTVINRQVEVGQTVAASFSAPVLFEVGENLHRMKVEASVDEADIGRIREGMACRFTVDAYPQRRFRGRIQQIRKAPEVVQNVVTYKVIITAGNDDLALLPGMTANVEMVLGSKSNVLMVPNAALRFAPRGTRAEAPAMRGGFGGGGAPRGVIDTVREQIELTAAQAEQLNALQERLRGEMRAAMQSRTGDRAAMRDQMQEWQAGVRRALQAVLDAAQLRQLDALLGEAGARRRATVWRLDEAGEPVPKRIIVGLQDDEATEVIEGLSDGDQVILRAVSRRA